MASPPPPPPPRKPPPPTAHPPAAQLPPEQPEPSGTSPGVVMGIIAAVILVVVGLPILSCIGCIVYTRNQAEEFVADIDAQVQQAEDADQQLAELREQALLVRLADRLYPTAKADISQHWSEPDDVKRKSWTDWKAKKIAERRYEVYGNLELSMRTGGSQTYRWACEYSTTGDPHRQEANWTLERISIDGGQVFP